MDHRTNRGQKNRGFSLVELIVVIAIMGILTGLVTISVSILSGKQARQCRDELLSSLLSVRTTTLGKKTATATITDTGNGYELSVTTTVGDKTTTSTSTICKKGVTLYYYSDAEKSTTRQKISTLAIEFDRASGALKSGGAADVYYIYAEQNGKEYGIRIYPETGKMKSVE